MKLPQWWLQAFHDIFLYENIIGKFCGPKFTRETSPGISYRLWNKNFIGWRGWNIAIHKWNRSQVFSLSRPSRSIRVNPSEEKYKCIALCCVFSLRFNRIHSQSLNYQWMDSTTSTHLLSFPSRASDCIPTITICLLPDQVSEFKGHTRRLTLRIGGNRWLRPFSVCCGGNFGENCR